MIPVGGCEAVIKTHNSIDTISGVLSATGDKERQTRGGTTGATGFRVLVLVTGTGASSLVVIW